MRRGTALCCAGFYGTCCVLYFIANSMLCNHSQSGHTYTPARPAARLPPHRPHRPTQTVAFLIPAVALIVLSQPGITPQAAVACMTVALGTTSLGQAGFVANMSDIAPTQAGKMFGLCNTFGCMSGVVGVTAVGFIVDAFKSFNPVFQITAAMYVLGTVVWLMFCSGEKIFD